MRVDNRQLGLESRLVTQCEPFLARAATRGGLLGDRPSRHRAWQGASGHTAERVRAGAIKETSARNVIHAALPFQIAA